MSRLVSISAIVIVFAAAGQSAGAPPDAIDTRWLRAIACAESLAGVESRGDSTTTCRDIVVDQIRQGAADLAATARSAIAADSLLAGPLQPPPPPQPRQGHWGERIVRYAGLTSFGFGMAGIAGAWFEWDPELRATLGLTGATIGGAGAMLNMVRPRPKPPPWVDPNERVRLVSREMTLRDTFAETERAMNAVADELHAIENGVVSSDADAIALGRRYAEALQRTAVLMELQVAHAATVAAQCGTQPGFTDAAHARMTRLVAHLEQVSARWRGRRWIVSRSERNALDYLARVDR